MDEFYFMYNYNAPIIKTTNKWKNIRASESVGGKRGRKGEVLGIELVQIMLYSFMSRSK